MNNQTITKKKICLLGNEGVGKTSLANRFSNDSFSEDYKSTIGVKLFNKSIVTNNSIINFIIWDLRGGIEFYQQNKYYYNGAFAHIVMADCTNQDSVLNIPLYYQESRESFFTAKVFLCSSKSDLTEYPSFKNDISKICHQNIFEDKFTTSSKQGTGVNEMFQKLADLAITDNGIS